jgi:hypothetical protein
MEVLRDYAIRGHELEGMALFNFILTTHKGQHRRRDGLVFVPYLASSHKQDKGRLVRSSRDEVVPEIYGGWPPALQDTDDNSLYEASMLLLFNPWRNLRNLKRGQNSFGEAFAAFESVMSDEVRIRMDHIQSYHECEWSGLLGDIGGYSLFDGSYNLL